MNRTVNCILMLTYLQTGRIYKISELVKRLEIDTGEQVNPRNIIEYRRELEYAGYYINTIPGKAGGYQLDVSKMFPVLKFTVQEKESIIAALNYLEERNDFMYKNELISSIGKIFSSTQRPSNEDELTIINRFPLAMSQDEIKKRFDFLMKAKKTRKQIKFTYLSQKNTIKEHILDPYDLFMFNNAWFVIGWRTGMHICEVMYFKLNRIISFEYTNKSFHKSPLYKLSSYIDEFGFKNNGEWYHIEFEAYNQYASLVKERIYGKNQEIIEVDEKTTIVKVDMQNKENIISFILGFGETIKVLEPEWLINEIICKAGKICSIYGENSHLCTNLCLKGENNYE